MDFDDPDAKPHILFKELDDAIEEARKFIIRGTARRDQSQAFLRDIKLKWGIESKDNTADNNQADE